MRPFLGGGDMIANVGFDPPPWRAAVEVRGGHLTVAEGVGLGAAVGYLVGIGMEACAPTSAS